MSCEDLAVQTDDVSVVNYLQGLYAAGSARKVQPYHLGRNLYVKGIAPGGKALVRDGQGLVSTGAGVRWNVQRRGDLRIATRNIAGRDTAAQGNRRG